MIQVGLIGYGYWGPKLARHAAALPELRLAAICEPSAVPLTEAARVHAGVTLVRNAEALISDPNIDAVAIATPVESHFELALAALRAGKHVLIEKPITRTARQALRLIEESERRKLTLMVDHTYVFSPAVEAIAGLVRRKELGRLKYWESARLNLGLVREDVNVAWDLASHDFSILDSVIGSEPVALSATGYAPRGEQDQVAHITLYYADDLMAHVHASWLSPMKVRKIAIGGDRNMLSYDEVDAVGTIQLHDRGVDRCEESGLVRYRQGETRLVPVAGGEPLGRMMRHFAACIAGGRRPVSDGEAGYKVVRLLEAVDESLALRGRTVPIEPFEVVA